MIEKPESKSPVKWRVVKRRVTGSGSPVEKSVELTPEELVNQMSSLSAKWVEMDFEGVDEE